MLQPYIPDLIETLERKMIPQKEVKRLETLLYLSTHGQMEDLVRCLIHLAESTEFFRAPASTKYHGNKPFGLLEHSLLVTENLLKIRGLFAKDIPIHDCIVVGLLHDAGKAGLPGMPYYLPSEGKIPYETNPDIPFLTVAQRSLYLATNVLGFHPTADQYQAILIHDGLYLVENQPYTKEACPLSILLHHADAVAAFIQEI